MPTDSLQQDLEQRVGRYLQDFITWQTFVFENYNTDQEHIKSEFALRYRALIDTHCAPGKRHQGLVLSSRVDYALEDLQILSFKQDGDTAIVFTELRKTSLPFESIEPHEYEFKRSGGTWYLDEVYFNDGSGRYECL